MTRMDGLHLLKQSKVAASGVVSLVLRVRIVVRNGNSTWRYG